jgi:thiol-disulfide isomerase/thioredoxin
MFSSKIKKYYLLCYNLFIIIIKNKISFIVLLIIFSSIFTGCLEKENKIKSPDFTLTDINGIDFSLSDHRGEIVLINFFASWCLPCKDEMPELRSFYERQIEDVLMISIDVDITESISKIKDFKETYDAEWIFARDTIDEDVSTKYDVVGIPVTIIIDRDGYISFRKVGPVTENELVEETVKLKKVEKKWI